MKPAKPVIHGRDHEWGGADPLAFPWARSSGTATGSGTAYKFNKVTFGSGLTVDQQAGTTILVSASGGGIQFGVEPQAGTWLEIETTSTDPLHGRGVYITTSNVMEIAKTGSSGAGAGGIANPALITSNSGTYNQDITGILATADQTGSTARSTSNIGVKGESSGKSLVNYGVWGESSVTHTSTTALAAGVQGRAFTNTGAWSTGLWGSGIALEGSGTSNAVAGVLATPSNQRSDGTATRLIGVMEAIKGAGGAAINATPNLGMTKGTYVGNYVLMSGGTVTDKIDGMIFDMTGGSTSSSFIQAWHDGNLVFRVDMSGNIHIPAAASVINDL